MAKITRVLQKIFGNSASSGEFAAIGSKASGSPVTTKDLAVIQNDPKYLEGLVGITSDQGTSRLPYTEDMNSLFFLETSMIKYLFQSGVPEWLSTENYYENVSIVLENGVLWKSTEGDDSTPNINNQPSSNLDKWIPVTDAGFLIADLRNLEGKVDGQKMVLSGYSVKGDTDMPPYFWNSSSSAADNGGSVISTGQATGRWEWGSVDAVNIEWFGAKGDDATDNYAIIQYVLDNFKAVYIPEGIFVHSETLVIPSARKITGLERGGSFIKQSNAAKDCISTIGIVITIEDIGVLGGLTGFKVGDEALGPNDGAGRELLLNKVNFAGNAGIGIDIQQGWSNYFNEVKVFDPGANAVRLGTGFLNSTQFVGFRCTGIGATNTVLIDAQTLRSFEFDNCVFEGNVNAGSNAFKSTGANLAGLVLKSCYFEGHLASDIDFSASASFGVTIDGCSFIESPPSAILSPSGVTISGCTFTGDTWEAISDPTNCLVLNNSARNLAGSWGSRPVMFGTITNCVVMNVGDPYPDAQDLIFRDIFFKEDGTRGFGAEPFNADFAIRTTGLEGQGTIHNRFRMGQARGPYMECYQGSTDTDTEALRFAVKVDTSSTSDPVPVLDLPYGGASVLPGADSSQSLGNVVKRWTEVFADTGTINTSDKRAKTEIRDLSANEKLAAKDIIKSIGIFKFLSAIEKKGDEAREHVGVITQDVIAIMKNHGLEPFNYAFITFNEWEESTNLIQSVLDNNGDVVKEEYREVVPAGDRYGIRYSELAMFLLVVLEDLI